MPGAFYHKGLTIEFDSSVPRVAIDGNAIQEHVDELFLPSEPLAEKIKAIKQRVQEIIEHRPELKKREATKQDHIAILKKGVKHWNQWRRENPGVRPLLYDTDLSRETFGIDLSCADFSNANLIQAVFRGAELARANFHEANLGEADLSDANLTEANFCRTDLYKTNLTRANLAYANLQGTQLAKTNFEGAKLVDCRIYGLSAWDLKLNGATQKDLVIVYEMENEEEDALLNGECEVSLLEESRIIVDDLRVAQFIYLLLHNENIRIVIDTIAKKAVLILGRFTPERKTVLDALREALRTHGYSPILFDFEKPNSRDLTETVSTLAHLARFIIADLTDAKSIPQELSVIVPALPSVPVQPILLTTKGEYSMFEHFRRYPWVLEDYLYTSVDDLRRALKEHIIEPAEQKAKELEER
jgi:Pentapeptide repeats (8 copies)